VTQRTATDGRSGPKGRPGRLERVAASAGKLDGKNISFLVVDELHEWNLENWAILTNGTVGRRRAQILQITTAGHNLDTICGREYQKGQRIAAGEEKNPRYLFRWFQAPAGADYRDEETWRTANPSYGELVTREQLADKVANVPQAQFRDFDFHFGIDPRFLERTRQVLEADGLSVEEVPQSDSRMVPASQSLYELVVQGNVEHEGGPAFTRHIESAVAREAFSGGWRLSKGRSRKKMDAAVAAAMAAHIAVQERGRVPAAEPRILVLG